MGTLQALVIEDDQDLAEIFSMALQQAGYETETIFAGDLACSRLDEIVPDLIVLDLQLPEVSGNDVLDYVRNNPRFSKTRIIVATANPIRIEYVREEVDLVLVKPISVSQLSELASRLRPE